jgi:hypothetical protein
MNGLNNYKMSKDRYEASAALTFYGMVAIIILLIVLLILK